MRKYVGTFTIAGKRVVENEGLKIITTLLENDLVEICFNPATWESLHYCEKDQTYWLLSYEGSEGFGSETRILTEIDGPTAAQIKAEWGKC